MAEHLLLTFPETQVTEPITYRLATEYGVIPNIRRAAIENHFGWMVIELDGRDEDVARAKEYLRGLDIQIDKPEGDIVAG